MSARPDPLVHTSASLLLSFSTTRFNRLKSIEYAFDSGIVCEKGREVRGDMDQSDGKYSESFSIRLEEVVWGTSRHHRFSSARAGVELEATSCQPVYSEERRDEVLQGVFQMFVNLHNGSLVAASVAIVWSYGLSATVPTSIQGVGGRGIPENMVTTFLS